MSPRFDGIIALENTRKHQKIKVKICFFNHVWSLKLNHYSSFIIILFRFQKTVSLFYIIDYFKVLSHWKHIKRKIERLKFWFYSSRRLLNRWATVEWNPAAFQMNFNQLFQDPWVRVTGTWKEKHGSHRNFSSIFKWRPASKENNHQQKTTSKCFGWTSTYRHVAVIRASTMKNGLCDSKLSFPKQQCCLFCWSFFRGKLHLSCRTPHIYIHITKNSSDGKPNKKSHSTAWFI